MPFFQTSKNIRLFAKKKGLSLEEAGREIRYRELKKIAKQNGFTKIATGHNLDDNAETMLLNFIKGSGMNGLSGIVEKRDNIIRPILILTKNEIHDYLRKSKMNYRIDSSNLKDDYQRNYLRNQIIPMIRKQLNPRFDNAVFKTSELMKNVNGFINDVLDKNLEKCASFKNETLTINCRKLKELNEHLIGSFFHELTATKERNSIIIFNKKLTDFVEKEIKLKIGDKRKIGDNVISISEVNSSSINYSDFPGKEYVDAGKIKGSLILRKWKEGERFHPLGMKHSKKVSDFLNEQKIPSYNKKRQLVLTESGSIVWIVGIRIDERYRISKNTDRVLELCLS
ncbi:MAG: tRNA lysidine(34) synthetase TilS [Ignavibacteriaceae bacterium]